MTDVSSCPRSYPNQVTSEEQAAIGKLLQDPDYSHVPTGTLVKLAQRLKLVYAPTPNIAVYCDGGVENFNDAVDQTLSRFQLQRIHAQIDVDFSNLLIEAFWRSTKHNCLFQQKIDSLAALRKWTDFYVHEHNEVMPHHAFKGQTPNEMFFGTGKSVDADLKQAKAAARQARIENNRKRSCASCPKKEPELHKIQLDKP